MYLEIMVWTAPEFLTLSVEIWDRLKWLGFDEVAEIESAVFEAAEGVLVFEVEVAGTGSLIRTGGLSCPAWLEILKYADALPAAAWMRLPTPWLYYRKYLKLPAHRTRTTEYEWKTFFPEGLNMMV